MAASLKSNRGMTLAELLVIVVIVVLVFFIVLGANYFRQLEKARDAKKKENLNRIQNVVEDFHIDHERYPNMTEMVYALMNDVSPNWDQALAGKICGSRKTSVELNSYTGELPCNPESPNEDYVYFLFANKQKYAIFTTLENTADPIIEELGCNFGCSYFVDEADPAGSISYNYFNYYVGSTDFAPDNCYQSTTYHACYPGRSNPNERCQVCTDYSCAPGYATLYCNPQWCLQNCDY